MRQSTVTTRSDSAGDYEQEVFDCDIPKRIIIGIHGNGVRRWDGEKFFYQVAEHFSDSVIMLVDQNQVQADGCKLNSLNIMASRNQNLITQARTDYPHTPVWIVAHSMGCGISSMLNTEGIAGIIFVAPGVGDQIDKYSERYGADIINGKTVKTSDGLIKVLSKEFMDSCIGVKWQDKYAELLKKFSLVHVFESGADEIVDEERFELREMTFSSYGIINGAPHNFSGKFSEELFSEIDQLLNNFTAA